MPSVRGIHTPNAPMLNAYRAQLEPHVGPIRSILGLTRVDFGSMQAQSGSNPNHFEPLRPISVLARIHVGPIQVQNGSNPNPGRVDPIHRGSHTNPFRSNTQPRRTQSELISDRSDAYRASCESISVQYTPKTCPIRTISDRADPDRFSHASMSGQYKTIAGPARIHIGPIRSRAVLA